MWTIRQTSWRTRAQDPRCTDTRHSSPNADGESVSLRFLPYGYQLGAEDRSVEPMETSKPYRSPYVSCETLVTGLQAVADYLSCLGRGRPRHRPAHRHSWRVCAGSSEGVGRVEIDGRSMDCGWPFTCPGFELVLQFKSRVSVSEVAGQFEFTLGIPMRFV
jgi:hypothetical protein